MLILYKMTDILQMKSSCLPTEPQHVIHLYPVYCLETVLEVRLTLNPPLLSKFVQDVTKSFRAVLWIHS